MRSAEDQLRGIEATLDIAWEQLPGGVTSVERQTQRIQAVQTLQRQVLSLAQALGEACGWLDADLAHAPNTATSMADRELVARWRAALAGGSVAAGSGEE